MKQELIKKYTALCGEGCIEKIQPQLDVIGRVEKEMFDYITMVQRPENYEKMFSAESVLSEMAKMGALAMVQIDEILGIKEVCDTTTPQPPEQPV